MSAKTDALLLIANALDILENEADPSVDEYAESALSTMLSDAGRPLLFKMMFDVDSTEVDDFERLTVEYLKERGVLVPMTSDPSPGDTPEPWAIRLPGETK